MFELVHTDLHQRLSVCEPLNKEMDHEGTEKLMLIFLAEEKKKALGYKEITYL